MKLIDYPTESAATEWLLRETGEQGKGAEIRGRAFEFAADVAQFRERLAGAGFTGRQTASQLFRAASSVGANLEEADAAQSRADFISKCTIALKEARESRYWLRLAERTQHVPAEALVNEAKEIIAILTTIVKKSRAS